jgi:hypothetical protein
MFQIIRIELDDEGQVIARRPLQPPYDLWDDAMALAEFDASRCDGEYGYDEARDCWWACQAGRSLRFVVEPLMVAMDAAA